MSVKEVLYGCQMSVTYMLHKCYRGVTGCNMRVLWVSLCITGPLQGFKELLYGY